MSAFVCGNSHVTALAAFIIRHEIQPYWSGTAFTFKNAAEAGAILHAENVASVNHRYRDNDKPNFKLCPIASRKHYEPIEIIKMARCLEYQSCEHPSWKTSLAKEAIDAICAYAVTKIKGYGDAAWELPDEIRLVSNNVA